MNDRLKKLKQRIFNDAIDGFLVTSEINVRYLTGFTGDSTYLLITPQSQVLLSDRRYEEQLTTECPGFPAAIRGPGKSMLTLCQEVLSAEKISHLAIEAEHISYALAREVINILPTAKVEGVTGFVESLRSIKDASELAILRRAVKLAEAAFLKVRQEMKPTWSELEVAWRLEHYVREGGGEKLGFPAIVGVGPGSALPHYHPGRRKLAEHPLLLIDWGAKLEGYTSDLTRTIATGPLSAELQRVHAVVRAAHDAAIAVIAPGMTFEAIDAAARQVIIDAGYGERFSHGLGHGIGLQVHEFPRMAAGQLGTLQPGMVITVEPGIYIPSLGGVRIEDDCLVTENGCEILSSLPTGLEDSWEL
jgi:Xaa-Pro aminopeptidase